MIRGSFKCKECGRIIHIYGKSIHSILTRLAEIACCRGSYESTK